MCWNLFDNFFKATLNLWMFSEKCKFLKARSSSKCEIDEYNWLSKSIWIFRLTFLIQSAKLKWKSNKVFNTQTIQPKMEQIYSVHVSFRAVAAESKIIALIRLNSSNNFTMTWLKLKLLSSTTEARRKQSTLSVFSRFHSELKIYRPSLSK